MYILVNYYINHNNRIWLDVYKSTRDTARAITKAPIMSVT